MNAIIPDKHLVRKFFTFRHILLLLILIELFLMGSGQMLKFGSVTLRMVLYVCALLVSLIIVITEKPIIHRSVIVIVTAFIGLLVISMFTGVVNGNDLKKILIDIKPLLYLLMVIPFSLLINNIDAIFLVRKLIKLSGVVMAVIYLTVLLCIFLGYIDYLTIYDFVSDPDSADSDVMVSTEESGRIFYKGFLYLNIAFLFFIYRYKNENDKFIALILLFAIVMTFTRGFLFGLIMTIITMSIIEIKRKKSFSILIGVSLLVVLFFPFYLSFVGDKSDSDIIRFMLMNQVIEAITIPSIFIGHGFGIGVPIKPNGMEITYFEVFHKQGILGLTFWFALLGYMIYSYIKINIRQHKEIARPFIAGSIFVYFQSLTNPYLNNPIGMSMVLLTFITLLVIRQIEKNKVTVL